MRRENIFERQRAARCGDRRHIGRCLDAVGDDAVAAAVETGNALNFQNALADARDDGAAGGEKMAKILNFRLSGGVAQRCFALRRDGGKQDILRGADAGDGQRDVRAV